jgi:hypothetical protein
MMITDRLLYADDIPYLEVSLLKDEAHHETPVSFFTQEGAMTRVHEDEKGPIAFSRAVKSLRIDVHFCYNDDEKRNAAALIEGLNKLAPIAKSSGYSEIVFTTNVEKLAYFGRDVLGYEIVPDAFVLRKQLTEKE